MVWNDQKWVYEVIPSDQEEQDQEEETEETEDQEEDGNGQDISSWSIEAIEPCKCVLPPRTPTRIKMMREPKTNFKHVRG